MAATVKVWDPLVRIFHWCLVASFAVAWLSGDDWERLHIWAGYVATALIGLRLVWGVAGSHYARFGQFVRSPLAIAAYLHDVVSGREHRYVGHNPAGGLMIIALIIGLIGVCVTGWLYTTEAFWGAEWVEETHEAMANLLLILVGLHVAGVVLASLHHAENLVAAMVTGRKRAPAAEDIV